MAGNRDYSLDALKMILIILVIYAHIPLLNGLIPIGANVECDALTWHSVKGIYAFRDYSLDALKMILIILVIYAHIPLLNGLIPIGANVECDALTWHSVKGIYAFHMPLFVFLSGYLTKRKLLAVQFGKSQKLIKLFVVFHIVDLVLKWIVAGVRHSLHGIVCPSFALWYLLCLFYWRILISALPENINKKYAVSYSVLLSLLVGFIPIQGEFGFQRFFSFMPYFFLGHYYGRSVLKTVDNKVVLPPPRTYLLSGLIVIVLFVAILISSFNPRWLVVIISPYPDFKGLFFRLMFLCGSSILCYLILIVCKFKRDWSRNILAKVGSETLFFYLLHPYVLYVIVAIWSQMNDHINMLSAICITSVTVFILMLLRKIKPIYKFLR